MFTLNMLDYSFARPGAASMASGGIELVGRYGYDNNKGLTPGERDQLFAAEISINANYEAFSGMVLENPVSGANNVKKAVDIWGALGLPAGKSIDFSADTDIVTDADYKKLGYTFEAYNNNIGPYAVGCYGEYDVINWLFDRGLIRHGWQTLAWSHGNISPRASVYQFSIDNQWNGSAVDFGTILHRTEAFKYAWNPQGSEREETGNNHPIPIEQKDDDMGIIFYCKTRGYQYINGGVAIPIHSEGTLANLRAAGVKQVVVAQIDYDAAVKTYK